MKRGQTLVFLLIFIAIAITITTAAVAMIIANSQAAQKAQTATITYDAAESGAENALIRLLRDPNYTGETLTIGDSTTTIIVTGTNPKTVTSQSSNKGFIRTIQVIAQFTNGILSITSWQEIY